MALGNSVYPGDKLRSRGVLSKAMLGDWDMLLSAFASSYGIARLGMILAVGNLVDLTAYGAVLPWYLPISHCGL